jgi:glutamyl-tRNA synthetase
MRITTVVRGEEWISSVPLHLQLFRALGFQPITYAHVAPLMKQSGGGKRKLSKRNDPEATVDFYIEEGFPAEAVLYYLRGLANGRLAEMPLEVALSTPIRLDQCGVAGPLVDLVKLTDISADHVAELTGSQVLEALRRWAAEFDPEVAAVLDAEPDLALRALAVEREGVENPRKDLRKWSDFRPAYGFFFPQLFTPMSGPADDRLAGLGVPPTPPPDSSGICWRLPAARRSGGVVRPDPSGRGRKRFAASPKEFRQNPDAYVGSVREAAQIVRVASPGRPAAPTCTRSAGRSGRRSSSAGCGRWRTSREHTVP